MALFRSGRAAARVVPFALCSLLAFGAAFAAPPYSKSTTGPGPAIDGVVDALTDIYNRTGGGFNARAVAQFTRPANATAYAAGQLVANSTTAGSVAPLQFTAARTTAGTGFIRRVKLSKSGTSLTNASFRVHLYRNSPTASNGDGGTWLTTSSVYLGFVDVTIDKVFTDEAAGIGAPSVGSEILFDTASGSQLIYGLVEARAAYAPVSGETFTATLEVWPN